MRAVATILAPVLALTGCGIHRTSTELVGFRPGPGSEEITVVYVQRPVDSPGELEIVSQGPEQVRVKVLYRAAGGAQDDAGQEREAVAGLDAPLGSRTVVDDDGDPVPIQK